MSSQVVNVDIRFVPRAEVSLVRLAPFGCFVVAITCKVNSVLTKNCTNLSLIDMSVILS